MTQNAWVVKWHLANAEQTNCASLDTGLAHLLTFSIEIKGGKPILAQRLNFIEGNFQGLHPVVSRVQAKST